MYKMSSVTTGLVATNCYTIINEETNEAIMIDASGSPKYLLEEIRAKEAKPVAILLTHAHFDHVDAVKMVKSEYPDIEVFIGKNDERLLADPTLNLSLSFVGDPVSVTADRTVIDGQEIELSFKEFELLEYFLTNQGRALTRDNILNRVWNYDYFGDARTIDTHVKKLRAKLGEKGSYIKTIRAVGYKFEVDS